MCRKVIFIQPRGSPALCPLCLFSHLTLDTFPALGHQGGCRGVISSPGAAVRGALWWSSNGGEVLCSPGAADSYRGLFQEVCPSEENSVLR